MVGDRSSPTLKTILQNQLNSRAEEDRKKAYDSIFEIAENFSWEKQREFMDALFPDEEYKSLDKAGVKRKFAQIKHKLSTVSSKNLLIHFENLVASPPDYPGNIYDAPVVELTTSETNPNNITKLTLREDLEKNTYIQDCSYLSPKSGGANKPGPLGANYLRIYMTKDGRVHGQKLFIKQATDDNKPNQRENMSEVIAGRIMNAVAGDLIASTFHTLPKPGDTDPANVYVVSIFYDSYKDLHTAAHEEMQPGKKFPPRGKGAGGGQYIKSKPRIIPISKKILKIGGSNIGGTPDYQPGLEKVFNKVKRGHGLVKMANNLVGNHQGHSENEGIIQSAGEEAVGGIDFGGAFRRPYTTSNQGLRRLKPKTKETQHSKFERVVHPEQIEGRKYNVAYFLATPESIRYSKDFIDEIDEIANVDKNILIQSVDEAIDYAIKYYGIEEFLTHFASELDKTNKELDLSIGSNQEKVAATKDFLKNTLLARQLSLKEFAVQSKLKHIERGGNQFQTTDLMKEHPVYFAIKKELNLSYFDNLENILLSSLAKVHEKDNNLEAIANDFYQKIGMVLDLKDLIPKKELDQLSATENFLKYILQSGHYDFNNSDDQEILTQVCDEAYQNLKLALQKIPESNPSRKQLIKEMSPPDIFSATTLSKPNVSQQQTPKKIRSRSQTVPNSEATTSSTFSTSSMSKQMETQRIRQDLAQFGVVTQKVDKKTSVTLGKELQEKAIEMGADAVYKIDDRSPAKGAVYVDKSENGIYEVIPIKQPDNNTLEANLANAYIGIGLFVSGAGYGSPLYLYGAYDDEMTQYYLAICDANGIKAYDEEGNILDNKAFPRNASLIVPEHFKCLDPNKIKIQSEEREQITRTKRWMKAVEQTFQEKDQLLSSSHLNKNQLSEIKNKLIIDKNRCNAFISELTQNGITTLTPELQQVSIRLEQAIKAVDEKLASLPSGLKIMSSPKVKP